ncbi:MAG TPA: DUF421 domain-containing protein [Bacilli bacterium]|nr:DUF421 domain-containing protein [Bacilli bacterium]
MDIITMVLRTVFIYFFLLVILRIMGNRELPQLSTLDLLVSIMIAEMAVISIAQAELPLLYAILPIIVLSLIQISIASLSLKSEKLRKLVDGNSEKINEGERQKQRNRFDDLLTQLVDVEFAVLEPSGKLSIIPKCDEQLETPFPLILDGKIQHDHLQQINKNEFWLRQQLRKLSIRDIKRISYCVQYADESFFIDLKDEK